MAGMAQEIPELDRAGLRDFGLTTGALVVALFGLVFPWIFNHSWPAWPWLIAGGLGIWSLLAPAALRPLYRAWMRIGLVLNQIMTPLIMAAVFFLLITPIASVRRLAGKDALGRRFEDLPSYRVPSEMPGDDYLNRPY